MVWVGSFKVGHAPFLKKIYCTITFFKEYILNVPIWINLFGMVLLNFNLAKFKHVEKSFREFLSQFAAGRGST